MGVKTPDDDNNQLTVFLVFYQYQKFAGYMCELPWRVAYLYHTHFAKQFHRRIKMDNELSGHANGSHLVKYVSQLACYRSMTDTDITTSQFNAILKTMQY